MAIAAMGIAVAAQGGAWHDHGSSMPMGGMPMAGGETPMHEGTPMHQGMPMHGNATMAHDHAMCEGPTPPAQPMSGG